MHCVSNNARTHAKGVSISLYGKFFFYVNANATTNGFFDTCIMLNVLWLRRFYPCVQVNDGGAEAKALLWDTPGGS